MDRIDYFYFIVDTSASMSGRKIGAVNDAINNIIHRLKRFVASKDIQFKIILLSFADKPKWSNIIPIEIKTFSFMDLSADGEASNLGKALETLSEKLERQVETDINKGSSTTIIFFSDGLITDEIDKPINRLNSMSVYVNANRIAVAFDDEISKDFAEDYFGLIVNKRENIVIDDFVKLNKMLFEKYR